MRTPTWWPRLGLTDDHGSVAAEFAVAMPAVVLVAALCIGAVAGSRVAVQAQDAAGEAARYAARGDDPGAIVAAVGGEVAITDAGELRCATVTIPIELLGAPIGLTASATSCALRDVDAVGR